MTTTKLTTHADERSSYILIVNFYDENGAAATPLSAVWTLTDLNGVVVNGRKQVEISPLKAASYIPLRGMDLGIERGFTGKELDRMVLIEATYSSEFGVLPLNGECRLTIDKLKAIPVTESPSVSPSSSVSPSASVSPSMSPSASPSPSVGP
jgi:hypothetical protein